VGRTVDGQFVTLTTNQFSEGLKNLIGPHVTHVQRMNLEEIFVANVMHHREARGL
jgi:ABC-2 type transport system ATP-binding protein